MRAPESLDLRVLQWRARAPRAVLLGTAAVLSLAGVRDVVAPRSLVAPSATSTATVADPVAADGVAELFIRSFLGSGGAGGAGTSGVLEEQNGRRNAVGWSTVVRSVPDGPGHRSVVVAATTAERLTYLAVPVRVDRAGRWGVAAAPAVVGAPAPARGVVDVPGREVEDSALTATAARFLRHYLAGQADDLSADLPAGVLLVPPATDLRVKSIQTTTWVERLRRVAVELVAGSQGGRDLSLRYELRVVRVGGRWLVASVNTPTPDREVIR